MSRCETCKQEVAGDGTRFCGPACHPAFGKGDRHPGTPRFPGRRAARRSWRRR